MSGYSYIMLLIDISMNLIGIVLGILLIRQAKDNRLKMIWGVMVAICSINMLADNIGWIYRYTVQVKLDERVSLLIFSRMLKWFFFAHILSLFPIASLRPGWLTPLRTLIFSLPLIFCSLICLCYIWFNGYITPVYTLTDIFKNIGHLDIQIRSACFILSVVFPGIYFLIPFMGKWITLKRRLTLAMYLYIAGTFTTMLLYILFVIGTTDTIFTIYGFIVTFLPNVFSALYLFSENPLSSPRESSDISPNDENQYQEATIAPAIYRLHLKMTGLMRAQTPFTNPEYNLETLSRDLEAPQYLLTKAIQYSGFSGFNEYINHQRLEYFKKLALKLPQASIKELMFSSGFTSRSSFYRRFAEKEKMSPTEYLGKIRI